MSQNINSVVIETAKGIQNNEIKYQNQGRIVSVVHIKFSIRSTTLNLYISFYSLKLFYFSEIIFLNKSDYCCYFLYINFIIQT